MWVCVCLCLSVCVCERERERDGGWGHLKMSVKFQLHIIREILFQQSITIERILHRLAELREP